MLIRALRPPCDCCAAVVRETSLPIFRSTVSAYSSTTAAEVVWQRRETTLSNLQQEPRFAVHGYAVHGYADREELRLEPAPHDDVCL